jgi:hypothetical protein
MRPRHASVPLITPQTLRGGRDGYEANALKALKG